MSNNEDKSVDEFARQEKRYTTILDTIKLTILLSLGVMAFTLEKFAPKIDVIGSSNFYWILSLTALSIVSAALGLASSATGIVRAQKKDKVTLDSVYGIVFWSTTTHYLSIAVAAFLIFIVLCIHTDGVYKKESQKALECEISNAYQPPPSEKWKMKITCSEQM
jgi:hypothetical protein